MVFVIKFMSNDFLSVLFRDICRQSAKLSTPTKLILLLGLSVFVFIAYDNLFGTTASLRTLNENLQQIDRERIIQHRKILREEVIKGNLTEEEAKKLEEKYINKE